MSDSYVTDSRRGAAENGPDERVHVVLGKAPGRSVGQETMEQMLAEMLPEAGFNTTITSEIYDLGEDSPAIEFIKTITAPLFYLGWLKPRSSYWALRKIGVLGRYCQKLEIPYCCPGKRPIIPLLLNTFSAPEKVVDRLKKLAGAFVGTDRGEIRVFDDEANEMWYPVIDYDRCSSCGECLEFCIFDVYGRDDNGVIRAENPSGCKPGCPACSRICSRKAIMFPRYEDDAGIAGDDSAEIEAFDPAMAREIRDDVKAGRIDVAAVARACGCQQNPAAALESDKEEQEEEPKDRDRDYFDDLINGLVTD